MSARHTLPGASFSCAVWGFDLIESGAVDQMRKAAELPIAVGAALMPDAHVGYGLPIGGVLATDNAVVPYAVGVDIACRVKLSVLDLDVRELDRGRERLSKAIERETRFGVGAQFQHGDRREHSVMDDDWSMSPITRAGRDKAWSQLGTSGSGNHFVEFGELEVVEQGVALDGAPLAPGTYVALLSHSGSRGTGAAVCDHYSKVARARCAADGIDVGHLAWLSLDSQEGAEYWHAMELMGRYASANHACIHDAVVRRLGAEVIAGVENHHNFAWKERHAIGEGGGPRDVIVHRKGATPAGLGALGFIPGSMATPGYIVRGRGDAASLDSAAHGAGRRMSRTAATKSLRWSDMKGILERANVELLSAGIDEAPKVYKDIHDVMAAQADLVETLAEFRPRIVKMAPAGERAED